MTLVRRVARPLLAAIFIAGGLDQFKHPTAKAKTAGPLLAKVGPRVGLPDDRIHAPHQTLICHHRHAALNPIIGTAIDDDIL